MSYYRSIEMPAYEVLSKLGNNMEIRRYLPSKWVSAASSGNLTNYYQMNNGYMFNKLFRYISGENTSNNKIEMTAPVTVNMQNLTNDQINQTSDCSMAMRFYLPNEYHNKPPKPLGNNMCIESEPEKIVAVVRFNGNRSIKEYLSYRDLLVHSLGPLANQFDCNNFTTAGYNAPFDPIQIQEVWLEKIR